MSDHDSTHREAIKSGEMPEVRYMGPDRYKLLLCYGGAIQVNESRCKGIIDLYLKGTPEQRADAANTIMASAEMSYNLPRYSQTKKPLPEAIGRGLSTIQIYLFQQHDITI